MLLEVNSENIKNNIRKAEFISKRIGANCAIMIKDFYSELKIQDNIENRIWSCKQVYNSYNYIIFENNPFFHKGGLIVSIEEVKELSLTCKLYQQKFQGFIPVNMFDDREGLSIDKAILLLKNSEEYENEYFSLKAISFTNGCLNDDLFSVETLKEIILTLRNYGANYISVGGSYYLGRVLDKEIIGGINEIRIGEYAIYGTIPFHKTKNEDTGYNGISLEMKIIQVHRERNQAVLKGGSSQVDVDKSVILTKGYKFVSVSTEYTVLKYDKIPKVGETVKILPNYHSLIKLCR